MSLSSGPAAGRPPRLLVVFNPAAGRRRGRLFRGTLDALRAGGARLELMETTARGDAERFAAAADPAAWDAVVAAGGDGTINEVINGLAGRDLPLGLLPLGTANVLAREIGLEVTPHAIAGTILRGERRRIALGSANGRVFAAMAGIGFDARVVAGVSLPLKRVAGRLAYGVRALRDFAGHAPCAYRLSVDGTPATASLVIVANGRFYGGAFVCAPRARLEDPSFEVVLLDGPGRRALLGAALALGRGRLDRYAGARIVTAHEVVVEAPAGEPVQADGDIVTAVPVRIAVDPRRLDLLAGPA